MAMIKSGIRITSVDETNIKYQTIKFAPNGAIVVQDEFSVTPANFALSVANEIASLNPDGEPA